MARYSGPDHMTESNAGDLARRIEEFWREKGGAVIAWIESDFAKGHHLYCVRSNMLNGLPTRPSADAK